MSNRDSKTRFSRTKSSPFRLWFLAITSIILLITTVSFVLSAANKLLGEPPVEQPVDSRIEEAQSNIHQQMIANSNHFIYLPQVTIPAQCALNSEEQAVASFAQNHPGQGRSVMGCDQTLAQVAREKAQDMAQRSYFDHTNPDGFGPNFLVKQAGYELPNWYGSAPDANNIESIAAGYTTPEAVWDAWLNSSGHRVHVLAESAFWQDQTNYGIGYYYDANSPYRHYWVFLSAPPE